MTMMMWWQLWWSYQDEDCHDQLGLLLKNNYIWRKVAFWAQNVQQWIATSNEKWCLRWHKKGWLRWQNTLFSQWILSLYPVRPEWTVLWVRCVHLLHCKSSLCLLHLISHPTPVQCRLYKWPTSWFNDCMIMLPVPQDCRLPVFPVIMQALSSTHANYERPAQHHVLPNCGRERAPSSASLHPDLHLTRRRSSGGHLAQVALLQGGPPGPRGEPHHRSEELGDIFSCTLYQGLVRYFRFLIREGFKN